MQQYPEYLLWNRRKTLSGSPDPTHANGTNRPCMIQSSCAVRLVRHDIFNMPCFQVSTCKIELKCCPSSIAIGLSDIYSHKNLIRLFAEKSTVGRSVTKQNTDRVHGISEFFILYSRLLYFVILYSRLFKNQVTL